MSQDDEDLVCPSPIIFDQKFAVLIFPIHHDIWKFFEFLFFEFPIFKF